MSARAAIAVGILAALGVLCAFTGVWDPDFFHHLALGRAIARGADFTSDPLVYPFAERSGGLPGYWLGSLLIYLPAALFGTTGALALAGLLIGGCVALVFWDGLDGRREWPFVLLAFGLTALTLPELRIRSAPRPELFGNLLLAFTLAAVHRFEQGRPRLLLAFPFVALAWSQLHVSVAIGLGVVAIQLASRFALAAWDRLHRALPPPRRSGGTGLLAAILVMAAALVLLSPAGLGALRLAARFLSSLVGAGTTTGNVDAVIASFRGSIEELRPPAVTDWGRPFGLLVGLAIASSLLNRTRASLRELTTVLAFAFFASTAFRFTPLASVVAAPIAARNLSAWIAGWLERGGPRRRLLPAALGALLAVRAAASPTLAAQPVSTRLDGSAFPVRAAEYLRAIGFDGRVYNTLAHGGYLEWTLGRAVFQDGRGPAGTEDLADRYPEPVDLPRLARLDARWRFDALVISTEFLLATPALAAARYGAPGALADPRTWALVAFDDAAALYLRREGPWSGRARADEFAQVAPAAPLPPELAADATRARAAAAELARAVEEAPACFTCRLNLATLQIQQGDAAAAARTLGPAEPRPPAPLRATVALMRATAAERLGDTASAERGYRDAIRSAADPRPVRRDLAILLSRGGRETEAAALLAANLESQRAAEDLSLAAVVARRRGRAEEAAAFEREAAEASRRVSAESRVQQGIALLGAGQVTAARSAFLEASALEPRLASAQAGLGFADLASGRPDTAASFLQRALALDPGYGEAWLGLGRARELLGARDEAIAAYRRCVELKAGSPEALAASERLAALGAR